jgi:hypothetical protein
MVLRQGLPAAFIGIAAGLAGAFGLTRLMESLLYGVKPDDPASFAVLIPTRRAVSFDPVTALRCEQ